MTARGKTKKELLQEIEELQARLSEAEETLAAIQRGEVDAIVGPAADGGLIYTLQGAEQPYRVFFETMNEGAVTMDLGGAILYCNRAFADLAKVPLEKVSGKSFLDFIAKDSRQAVAALLSDDGSENRAIETSLKAAGGGRVPVSISVSTLKTHDLTAICAVVTNVSQMVMMSKLEHANEELGKLNKELKASEENLKGSETTLRDARKAALNLMEDAIAARKDAEQVNVILRHEIDKRKQAEEKLQSSEAKYRVLFENMAEGFALYELLYDEQGRASDWRVLEVNDAYSHHTGLARDRIVGHPMSSLFPEVVAEYLPLFSQVVASRKAAEFESYAAPAGRFLHVACFPAGPNRFANTITDITARKQAEAALRNQELKANAIINAADESVWLFGLDGRILAANITAARRMNTSVDALLGRKWQDLVPPDLAASRARRVDEVLRTDGQIHFEDERAGMIFDHRAYPVRDETGKTVSLAFFSRDITEQRRASEALRENEQRLRFHMENSPLAVIEWDRNFIVTRWAGEAERIFGRSTAETVGRPIMDLHMIYEEDLPLVETTMEKLTDGVSRRIVSSNRNYTRDGRIIHCEWYNSVLLDAQGKMTSVMSQVLDVTLQKLAESELRLLNRELEQRVAQRTRLYALLAGINGAILRNRDRKALLDSVCRTIVETGGFKLAWVGFADPASREVRPMASFGETAYLEGITVRAADVPEGRGPTGRAIVEGRPVINLDFETDGNMAPWRDRARKHGIRSSSAFPLRQAGAVIGALTIYSDQPSFFIDEELSLLLTLVDNLAFALEAIDLEQKKHEAEEDLRRSSAEIRDLYNNAPCGYHSLDRDGTIVRINDTELTWLGYTREEVVGKKNMADFYTPEGARKFRETYPQFVRSGSVANLEFDLVRKDGTTLQVLLNGTAMRDENGVFVMSRSTMVDVTARKEAERREATKNGLVQLFAQKVSRDEYLNEAAVLIRAWSGCRHVGIRIRDSEDGAPFLASAGYDRDFLSTESALSLSRDRCICTRVLSGGAEDVHEQACMTPNGSFFSNDGLAYRDGLPRELRKSYRAVCLHRGFASLAVVPIRYRGRTDGAIHLADERKGMVPLSTVEFIEQLAMIVGEALLRFGMEEDLRKSRETLIANNEALRNLQAHIEAVREGERANIAREVHDQLGQVLTALKMDIAWMSRHHPSRSDEVQERSKEMLDLVDGAIQSVKKITSELRPSVLDDFGLQAAIEWTMQDFEKRSGVQCRVRSRPDTIALDRTRSTVIYRVLQESLTNVARHAQAKNVTVTLDQDAERFCMTVRDDGTGIAAEMIGDPSSYGLMGMRERLRFLGGDVTFSGSPGQGTTVSVTIPLSVAEEAAEPEKQPPYGDRGTSKEDRT